MEKSDIEGKTCGACLNTLTSEYFSKKQWKQKQRRRCKKCAESGKEIDVDGLNDMLQCLNTESAEIDKEDDDSLVIGAPLRFKVRNGGYDYNLLHIMIDEVLH